MYIYYNYIVEFHSGYSSRFFAPHKSCLRLTRSIVLANEMADVYRSNVGQILSKKMKVSRTRK